MVFLWVSVVASAASAIAAPPSISDLPTSFSTPEDEPVEVTFTVDDPDGLENRLTATAQSSNQTLVPNGNLTLSGNNRNRRLRITLAPNAHGETTITLTVSDDSESTSKSFILTVQPINDPPTVSSIANVTLAENQASGPIAFTIGDPDVPAASLVVTATSANQAVVSNSGLTLGGSGSSRTIRVQPVSNAVGTANVTVTVRDDAGATASHSFFVTVTAAANAPTIGPIANASTPEDSALDITIDVADPDTNSGELTLSATSSNQNLLPNSSITFLGTGPSRTMRMQPAANQNGTTSVTVTVHDGAGGQASDTFILTVVAVNDPPQISSIANVTIAEDSSTGDLPFSVTDVDDTSLTVTAASSNTGLVPVANIALQGSGSARTITVTPASNQTGSTTITVTVNDGSATRQATFVVTVTAVNDPPTLSELSNTSTPENTPTGPIAFTIGDPDDSPGSLTVTATSSDQSVVANTGIALGGSGATRTVRLTPVSSANGTSTITVTVRDQAGAFASDSFVLTVTPGNDRPTISALSDQTTPEDTPVGPLQFTVGDHETNPNALIVTAESSNPSLVPQTGANLTISGSGASRTLRVTPATNRTGSATITLTVEDADGATASTSFVLTVTPVNDPPTISAIGAQSTAEDVATAAIPFTVSDVETSAGLLAVSGSSDNVSLVPVGNITFGGSGQNRTVTVRPSPNASGTAVITVVVNDGESSQNRTFQLTVTPAPDPPQISAIADQQTAEDTPSAPVPFVISDPDNPPGDVARGLTVSGTSSNTALVPNGGLVFGGAGQNRTVTLRPEFGQSGATLITVTVSTTRAARAPSSSASRSAPCRASTR